ncbi:MAG: hypothetical protein ACI4IM_00420 [Acutalibacteraceae bacterium]
MEKYEVMINGSIILKADQMSWEYPQTDGEGSGATDENIMIREVLPERDKISLSFNGEGMTEADIRTVLAVRKMDSCTVNYYDLRSGARVTRTMYPVSDAIKTKALIDGNFIVESFELRFIQTIPV